MAPYIDPPSWEDFWSRQEQTLCVSMESLCSRAGSAILANAGAKREIHKPPDGSGTSGLGGSPVRITVAVALTIRVRVRVGVVADDRLGEGARVVFEQAPAAGGLAEDRPAAVRQAAEAAPVLGGQAEQAADRDAGGAAVADHDEGAARGDAFERAQDRGTTRSATSISSSPPPRRTEWSRFQAANSSGNFSRI